MHRYVQVKKKKKRPFFQILEWIEFTSQCLFICCDFLFDMQTSETLQLSPRCACGMKCRECASTSRGWKEFCFWPRRLLNPVLPHTVDQWEVCRARCSNRKGIEPSTDNVDVRFSCGWCMGRRVHSLVQCHVVCARVFSFFLCCSATMSDCIWSAFWGDTYFCTGDQD